MLNIIYNGQVIGTVAVGATAQLPNGDYVSPALDGWTDGTYSFALAPAVPPTDVTAPPSLSFPQLLHGLVTEAWITSAEADAWLIDRTLPASLTALIDSLPADQRLLARARALQPTEVLLNDPMVQAMGAAQGKTPAQMEAFFATYSQV